MTEINRDARPTDRPAGTLLLTDPAMVGHDPGAGHPESPRRLSRIIELFQQSPIQGATLHPARPATDAELQLAHSAAHVASITGFGGQDVQIDPDTRMCAQSLPAARLAVGASVEAVTRVWRGEVANAFALVRPPGHHAEPDRAMGFCLFNNAAIAAEAALQQGARRVAVLDWDVHHGNGTQAAFWNRSDVLYLSCHQFPYYPGTGAPTEIGEGEGRGFTVNCALSAGQTDADYGAVFEALFLPILQAYAPDLLIVSAGFDPHENDPIGGMQVTERGFAAMAASLQSLAHQVCGGKLVLLLEGGYDLAGLSRSAHACAEILTGTRDSFPSGTSPAAAQAIAHSREALRPYWSTLR